MLTRGSADSLSRIRVSADAMEMEMAMTADGAVVHGGPTVRRGGCSRSLLPWRNGEDGA